jgi:hypothetical protein
MHNLNKSAERKNSQKNPEEMFIVSTSLNVSSFLATAPVLNGGQERLTQF